MTRTFEEMCAERDPVYAELKPEGAFWWAKMAAWAMTDGGAKEWQKVELQDQRDAHLLKLAIRALRNQGQPYYDRQS